MVDGVSYGGFGGGVRCLLWACGGRWSFLLVCFILSSSTVAAIALVFGSEFTWVERKAQYRHDWWSSSNVKAKESAPLSWSAAHWVYQCCVSGHDLSGGGAGEGAPLSRYWCVACGVVLVRKARMGIVFMVSSGCWGADAAMSMRSSCDMPGFPSSLRLRVAFWLGNWRMWMLGVILWC